MKCSIRGPNSDHTKSAGLFGEGAWYLTCTMYSTCAHVPLLVMILPLPKKRVEIVSYIVHLHVHVCLLKNVNSLKIYMHDFIIHLCCRTLNMCVSCCVVRSCSVAYIPVRRLATVDTVSLAGSTVSLYYVSFVV